LPRGQCSEEHPYLSTRLDFVLLCRLNRRIRRPVSQCLNGLREPKNPSYCNPSEFRTKANFTSDYAFPKKAQPTSSKSGHSGYCSRGQVEYFDDSGTTIANALPWLQATSN
jgi:hypothetical protein